MWSPKFIDTDKVLYIAIADAIETDINNGILRANEKMPPQRSIAKIIGVNLTTISRAYKEAERRGLISGIIGKGTFVSKKTKLISLQENLNDDEIIELGTIGAIRDDEYNLSELLEEIAKKEDLNDLFDYIPSQGMLEHRKIASNWINQYGVKSSTENTVVCAGAMHAINCCLLGIFRYGDRIAVDSLTFTGFKNSAQFNNIKLEPVLMDSEGMVPEELENLCQKFQIKGIYLMPNIQNPTATSMSNSRKEAVAKIILKYNLILIEDDIYNFTNLSAKTALSSLVPENGIFICGLSKTFFPGLRIAFVSVPEQYLYKFVQAVTNTIWMTPPICAEITTRLINSKIILNLIRNKNNIIISRIKIVRDILKDFDFLMAENGMFLWLNLPEFWSPLELENIALINKVRIIPAYKFYVGNQTPPKGIRISLVSVKNNEQLIKGLNILVKILKQNPQMMLPIM